MQAITVCLTLLLSLHASAKQVVFNGNSVLIGKQLEFAEDKTASLSLAQIQTLGNFKESREETPNFGISKSAFWLRFTLTNNAADDFLMLEIPYPIIDSVTLYEISDSGIASSSVLQSLPYKAREFDHENIVFRLHLKSSQTKQYYLRVKGDEQTVVPVFLHSQKGFFQSSLNSEIITGIHVGILVVMILYNLFIFFSIFEISYLYYVLYILFIGLTQTTISGVTYKYLWPNQPWFNNEAIVLFPALGGSFAILFFRNFLSTKTSVPKLDFVLRMLIIVYVVAVIARLTGFDSISYRLIDFSGLTATILGIGIAAKLSAYGYRPAKFFLIAWTIFLIGIILFVLRNLNVLPYNNFTSYTMQAGTDSLVVLLSFALADKINVLKKEEAAAREEALQVSQLNETIIREQNIMLERKVAERTVELQDANDELSDALTKLKDAQTQLIDSEKMASLGQLTAGIAHEINNPINFVSSNIRPLRRDIGDLLELLATFDEVGQAESMTAIQQKLVQVENFKKEIDLDYLKEELEMLLNGMEDGAKRTVEIVKGLKIFSRVDEADLNTVNINEGIESTLVILNNQMGSRMKLVKELGGIPAIECYPGKLNQVFMNIITNSIHATHDRKEPGYAPEIQVKTCMFNDETVLITIKDNGIGMTPEVKAKIFEPFFTTKEVGRGTGLGLSIVFKIIEAHGGTIEINTAPGEGTEFLIKLPVKRK